MAELFSHPALLAAFAAASVVLAITPGPGVIYIVARSVTHGRRLGLASVAGVAAGNWCNALGASLGLAALFAVSSVAFTAVKWAGAAYLIYLGVRTITGPTPAVDPEKPAPAPLGAVFRDGFLVALLNPKTAVFFAAFLPQFMAPEADAATQAVLLGTMFVAIAAVTDGMYALTASAVSSFLSRSRVLHKGGRFLTGGALIGLGVYATVGESRRARG